MEEETDLQPSTSQSTLVLGAIGIKEKTLLQDIRQLMFRFAQKRDTSFLVFVQLWTEASFDLVHVLSLDDTHRHLLMSPIYAMTLAWLSLSNTIHINLAVLYTLYSFYFTQPSQFKRVAIRMTPAQMTLLHQVYQVSASKSFIDPIYVYYRLVQSNAFVLVAQDDSKKYLNQ